MWFNKGFPRILFAEAVYNKMHVLSQKHRLYDTRIDIFMGYLLTSEHSYISWFEIKKLTKHIQTAIKCHSYNSLKNFSYSKIIFYQIRL